jgi:hypothetical protein
MKTKTLYAGAAAVLLLAGTARAEDSQPTQPDHQGHDAAHAVMHEAMQHQLAAPAGGTQMPGMPEQAAGTAMRARDHAAQAQQQHREAARDRAMKRGAQDAAMARTGSMHGGTAAPHSGSGMSGGMMGEPSTAQQGAGMMRTGDMHGGTGGMMPGGGGMMGGGQTGGSGGGMMGATSPTPGTTPTTAPGAPSGGGTMMGK